MNDKTNRQQPQPIEVAGWRFKPMASIIAPVELHGTISDVLSEAALKGMFDSKTDAETGIDELLDGLMMAEAFNVRCSLTHYTEELRRHNIMLGSDSLFNRDFARMLLSTLADAVQALKEYNDRPNKLKGSIADIVKRFDDVPVWGLFFQILTLQGIADLLERLDINEGDTGFDEAQTFYNWLLELLIEKEWWFACVSSMTYGDGDLQRLEPLCEYLMSTYAGKITQELVKGEEKQPDRGHGAASGTESLTDEEKDVLERLMPFFKELESQQPVRIQTKGEVSLLKMGKIGSWQFATQAICSFVAKKMNNYLPSGEGFKFMQKLTGIDSHRLIHANSKSGWPIGADVVENLLKKHDEM